MLSSEFQDNSRIVLHRVLASNRPIPLQPLKTARNTIRIFAFCLKRAVKISRGLPKGYGNNSLSKIFSVDISRPHIRSLTWRAYFSSKHMRSSEKNSYFRVFELPRIIFDQDLTNLFHCMPLPQRVLPTSCNAMRPSGLTGIDSLSSGLKKNLISS